MPTYEYECKSCGYMFEHFQNMSDKPLAICPQCGGSIRRLIGSGSGIIFKGTGFYATDYGSPTKSSSSGVGANCARNQTCCGRNTPCERSPRRT